MHVQRYMCSLNVGICYWCSLVWMQVAMVSIYCNFYFVSKCMHCFFTMCCILSLYSSVDCAHHHWGHTASPGWLFIYQNLLQSRSYVWRIWIWW